MKKYLDITPEVQEALKEGTPVVALETTMISHGMPYPDNVRVIKEVIQIMKDEGVVPALIGVKDGKIKIGLTEEEIEIFGKSKEVVKLSRRDLADAIATNKIGATTVASTMICASLAGIKFFATGGPGGVHRGWIDSMDISADMDEFAQTNVTVICGGPKCILDLPATLECLETKGVPVIGYGVKNLPAFLTRDSGLPLQISYDNPKDIAEMIKIKWELGLNGGVLVAYPINKEDEQEYSYIEGIMTKAMKEANEKKIVGKEVTPFLLQRMSEITGGNSLESNMKMFKCTAKVGAQIAVEYYNKCRE